MPTEREMGAMDGGRSPAPGIGFGQPSFGKGIGKGFGRGVGTAPSGSGVGSPAAMQQKFAALGGLTQLDIMYEVINKSAAVPMPGGDPAAMGGMPPGMPPGMDPAAMGGMPPGGDPAAMGGMPPGMPPPDPAAAMGGLGGAGPMDPAMMAGLPGGLPPEAGGPPPGGSAFTPEQQSMLDQKFSELTDKITQAMQGAGGGGKGGKVSVEQKIDELNGQVKGIMTALTGFMAGKEGKPITDVPEVAKLQVPVGAGAEPPAGGGLPGAEMPGQAKSASAKQTFGTMGDFGAHVRADNPADLAEKLAAFFRENPWGKSGLRA